MVRFLTEDEIQEIITDLFENFKIIQTLPEKMAQKLYDNIYFDVYSQLKTIQIHPEGIKTLKQAIVKNYKCIEPSKSVGIICGQSIGEMSTQNTLNVFHSAGISNRITVAAVPRFLEIIDTNRSETQGAPVSYIFLKAKPKTITETRQIIGSDLVCFYFNQLQTHHKKTTDSIIFTMNLEILFRYKITLKFIVSKIENLENDIQVIPSPLHMGLIEVKLTQPANIETVYSTILQTKICGIDRIENIFITKSNDEWCIETDGSNLEEILNLPFVDAYRTYSNDIWEIYNLFGIESVRAYILNELTNLMPNIHKSHIELLSDRMTVSGKLKSISRYTRKHESSSVLSKVTFEETLSGFLRSALFRENDQVKGVSASIICGSVPNVGSGMNELVAKNFNLY